MCFDTLPYVTMDSLDEQLDAANAKVLELSAQVAELEKSLKVALQAKTDLETAHSELSDNLADTKARLAKQEEATREAHARVQVLEAEAKSAEQRAAEFYGAKAGEPVLVTAAGEPRSVAERFRAATTPAAQTALLRSLSQAERNELFADI